MRVARNVIVVIGIAAFAIPAWSQQRAAERYRPPVADLEVHQQVAMPPGFGVQHTDVDGPVFVDARGMTMYKWQKRGQRNGDVGEVKGKPTCDGTKYTVSSGLMSPYPPGLQLPDLDTRPTCIEAWPPVYAGDDAKDVGKFSVVERGDGRKQWAYDGYALYTSYLDKAPGQVNGAQSQRRVGEPGGLRTPVGPPPVHPPAFEVATVATGRLLTMKAGYSVYVSDADGPNKSNCNAACQSEWKRVAAGHTSVAQGEWGIIDVGPGQRQWTFRGRPLYTRVQDRMFHSLEGSDSPGWHNVYTQRMPDLPKDMTIQDSRIGQVIADKDGRTVYIYNCIDDALDQMVCNHPATTQAYRLAICGNGDPALCNKTWPYLLAAANEKSAGLIWGTAWIDPTTGRFAEPDAAGALHVRTFRDRPLYLYSGDTEPGDPYGDGWGEVMGARNGFKAFWVRRDDFVTNPD